MDCEAVYSIVRGSIFIYKELIKKYILDYIRRNKDFIDKEKTPPPRGKGGGGAKKGVAPKIFFQNSL